MVLSGVPQTAARPVRLPAAQHRAGLDCITTALETSKSSASVAARLLQMYTLACRHGERDGRGALYAVSDNYEGMLIE